MNTSFSSLIEFVTQKVESNSEIYRTVKLAKDAVRIGDHDITVIKTPHRSYRITRSDNGSMQVENIESYDIALKIVRLLNMGMNARSSQVLNVMSNHFEYVSSRDKSDYHRERAKYYYNIGDYDKQDEEEERHEYHYDRSRHSYLRAIQ